MLPYWKNFLKALLEISLLILLVSCATVEAPGGGPVDKLPPRIAGVYPAPNSISQSTELNAKIEFDEWINSTLAKGAVFISPPIEKRLRFDVDGNLLTISSKAKLDSHTTYTITIGNGIKDLRGNPLAEPFLLVFSTGNEIDSLTLTGRVIRTSEMIRQKQFPSIGLYLIGEEREKRNYLKKYRDSTFTFPDTQPRFTVEEPLYITQADSNGWFRFQGLKDGWYRAAAFLDLNGNQKIEPIGEWAGLGEKDIHLDSVFNDSLWFTLADQDTVSLRLETVEQVGNRILAASFSRNVQWDSTFSNPENCFLKRKDSSLIYPAFVYPAPKTNLPHFYFERIPLDSLLEFSCKDVKDSANRELDPRLASVSLTLKKMSGDTLGPSLSMTIPSSGTKMVFPQTPLELVYNKPIQADSLENNLRLILFQDTLPVQIIQKFPNRLEIKGNVDWPTDAKIRLVRAYLDTSLAAADSTGFRDTLITQKFENLLQFETIPRLRIASLEGVIPGASENTWVRLRSLESGEYRKGKCLPGGSFHFEFLPEGSYVLDYYHTLPHLDIPYSGKLQPLDRALPWRSPREILILKNGTNHLDSLGIILPPLP